MDLRKIQEREDWSPDCDNLTASVTSNRYSFTMRSVAKIQFENVTNFDLVRAVVANVGGEIFVGDWSRALTLPAICQSEYCKPLVVLRQEISKSFD